MENARLMPDFTASNIAVSVGEALAKLEVREIEAENIRFKIVDKHSAFGEIVGQSPVPDTFIGPNQKIILDVNPSGRRKLTLSDLLQRLSTGLQFSESRFDAGNQLSHLLVDMNTSKPSIMENGLKETMEQWFESCGVSEMVQSFSKIFFTTESDALIKAIKNTHEDIIRSFASRLANNELATILFPFFTEEIRKKFETEESRFSFFQATSTLAFEKTLSSAERKEWESFQSYLVHVYARLELKENLTHGELLNFFIQQSIMPIILNDFEQSVRSKHQGVHSDILYKSTVDETIRNQLTNDLAVSVTQPINLWHMQELFKKYLKLKPDEIQLKIDNDKATFTFSRKESDKNNLWIYWLDYLFRPLSVEINYLFESKKSVNTPQKKSLFDSIDTESSFIDLNKKVNLLGLGDINFDWLIRWVNTKYFIYIALSVTIIIITASIVVLKSSDVDVADISITQKTEIQSNLNDLIRNYYITLNNINPLKRYKKALNYWLNAPKGFRKSVENIKRLGIPEIKKIDILSKNKANIYVEVWNVEVSGSSKDNYSRQYYKIIISVEKVYGDWKITGIKAKTKNNGNVKRQAYKGNKRQRIKETKLTPSVAPRPVAPMPVAPMPVRPIPEVRAPLTSAEMQYLRDQETRHYNAIEKTIKNISIKIERSWVRAQAWDENLKCVIRIELLRGGGVTRAQVIKGSGNHAFDISAHNAVFKASPLPVPDHLFKDFRIIDLPFTPI